MPVASSRRRFMSTLNDFHAAESTYRPLSQAITADIFDLVSADRYCFAVKFTD